LATISCLTASGVVAMFSLQQAAACRVHLVEIQRVHGSCKMDKLGLLRCSHTLRASPRRTARSSSASMLLLGRLHFMLPSACERFGPFHAKMLHVLLCCDSAFAGSHYLVVSMYVCVIVCVTVVLG
jgi:hypothetical protein